MNTVARRGGALSRDVAIIGGGIIGLVCAAAIGRRGAKVLLLSARRRGEASSAAAGLLAPGLESPADPAAQRFAVAARDAYPRFLTEVFERTGRRITLNRAGIIELGRSRMGGVGTVRLDARSLQALEPALALESHAGAVLHQDDGFVDNVALMKALEELSRDLHCVERVKLAGRSVSVAAMGKVKVGTDAWTAARIVIAAGAWSSAIDGLPRPLPVTPLRGQMIAIRSPVPVRHAIYGAGGYIIPRGDELLVGATSELAGWDAGVTSEAREQLLAVAELIAPALHQAPVIRQWAGLRPVTPDLQPVLGVDPDRPDLIYACGHSRNGILLAPLTGECVAALVAGTDPPHDISPFQVMRFSTHNS